MTNETTASQPKSIGDDALGEFIDEYEWRTDEFCHKPTETERLMLLDFAVNLDDSRAPAAQASATIQAAPTLAFSLYTAVNNMVAHIGMCGEIDARHDLVAKVMDELHKLDDGNVAQRVDDLVEKAFMPKDQATKLAVEEYCYKADAATIQEPVMVAEPVCGTCDAIASHRHGCPEDAAPMVADPAGVALRTRYEKYMDWCQRSGYDALTWPEFVDSRINSGQRHHAPITYGIAATVKAVPSDLTSIRCPVCCGSGSVDEPGDEAGSCESYGCEECHGQGKIIVDAEDVKAVPSEALDSTQGEK